MEACGATIPGGGTAGRNQDFCVGFAFSLQLAVQRLVRVAIKDQVPVGIACRVTFYIIILGKRNIRGISAIPLIW